MKKNLCILFGGNSTEYAISLLSTANVLAQCRKLADYDIYLLGISQTGVFYEYLGPDDRIPTDEWLADPAWVRPVSFIPGRLQGYRREASGPDEVPSDQPIDIFFPVLHGQDGEGGPLQGFLEILGAPYVGSKHLSAGLMMDKAFANTLFEQGGLAQTPWLSLKRQSSPPTYPQLSEEMAAKGVCFPLFVKPANAGSSVGISKVADPADLAAALNLAFSYDRKLVLENAVQGRELEVAVLEDTDGQLVVSPAGEIVPGHDFYDYEDKYAADSQSRLLLPADLSPEQSDEIRRIAAQAFQLADCRGLARVDFFLRAEDGAILINEINTMPGFTAISMYSKLIALTGLSPQDLMIKLIHSAY